MIIIIFSLTGLILLIEGDIGTGKTLLATYYAITLKNYKHIYANYHIKDDRFIPFDLDTFYLGRYSDALIIIDEAYTIADSRDSFNKNNLDFSIAAFQSRKMRSDIIYTCQIRGSIDIRLRDSLTYLISCNNTGEMFEYTIFQKKRYGDNMVFLKIKEKTMTHQDAKKYFKYYDTYEIVSTQKQKSMNLTKKEKDEIFDDLKQQTEKSKDFVNYFLMKKYKIIDAMLVKEMYYRLKGIEVENPTKSS